MIETWGFMALFCHGVIKMKVYFDSILKISGFSTTKALCRSDD